MNYHVSMTRKTFDGLCSYLQSWGQIYSQPGAVPLRGSFRSIRNGGSAVVRGETTLGSALDVSRLFNTALCGLGRSRVLKNQATVDLRDLTEEEVEALAFVAKHVRLKAQQTKALTRILDALIEFVEMPAMLRLAIAAED